jgi:Protein of unknown function (DUF3300)
MKTRLVAALCSLMLVPSGVPLFAQDQAQPNPPAAAPAAPQQTFAPEQLDSMVAPIALYPDSLLSQVLVASTYPLELVEANQWLGQHSNVQGQELIQAAQQQQWDPSIQALVAFPDVVKRLTSDIRWTTDLGNAFLAQQDDVMAAVQRMRARARDSGKLADTPQERVEVQNQGGQSAIQIVPTDPQVVYVPTYDPAYFWGAPPPFYPWPGLFYPGIGVGWGFGYGIHLGFFFGGCCGWGGWGWGPNWFGGGIFVHNNFFHRYGFHEFDRGGFRGGGREAWVHNPAHRLGVPYGNHAVAQRFESGNFRGGAGGFNRGAGGFDRGGAGNNFAARGGEARGSEARGGGIQNRGATPDRGGIQGQSRSFSQSNNHSAFGGSDRGSGARIQSDHGFSSMGPARTAPAFHGGGFGGGGHAGGGGHGGGGRR